jgi:3-hydroxy acid dehydrogenase / malonic semialdehyde reductase
LKTIFITGATSGFGKTIAEKFAANHFRIIITGRRKERLEEISTQLKSKYAAECLTLNFDVRNKMDVKNSISSLTENWKAIDILVNNAGLASGLSLIQDGDEDDWDKMIDTNVKGLLSVSRQIMPMMIARGSGHIFNIGSTAGKIVYEKGNIYCATKFAVDAISQAMRIDLLKHNIKVTAINPGAAETEFSLVRFKGDSDKAKKVYDGFIPMKPEDIADIVFFCATLPGHVCINDLTVTPTSQASSIYINRNGN